MTGREEQARATALARATAARQRARRFASSDPMHGVMHPQQYDEAGIPVQQRPAPFAERIRRLLVG